MAARLRLSLWFFGVILVLCISLMISNLRHGLLVDDRSVLEISLQASKASSHNNHTVTPPVTPPNGSKSTFGSLLCQRYGGPDDGISAEMVYWHSIDADRFYVSRFRTNQSKYLLYRPEKKGFNNFRMNHETLVALAAAMGRTLVWPPAGSMEHHQFGELHWLSRSDFFHDSDAIDAISTEEFLTRHALTGQLVNRDTGQMLFPPENRTNFDGEERQLRKLYYQQVMLSLEWCASYSLAIFPAVDSVLEMFEVEARTIEKDIQENPPDEKDYIGRPVPLDAPLTERLRENWAERPGILLNEEWLRQEAYVIIPIRVLSNFYESVMYEDWNLDLWMRRFIRDEVRYRDELHCAAARVVQAVRSRSHVRNQSGAFDSMHVRRGDFLSAFPDSNVTAERIYEETKKVFPEGATVYMATNEKDRSFFQPLMDHYDIVFLDDFQYLLGDGIKSYQLGLVDQLVAARGRYFMGCWWSSFTGYINRLRGYHSQKHKAPGYEEGILDSWYYYRPTEGYFEDMRQFVPPNKAFCTREYPTGWRQLEFGMEAFHKSLQQTAESSAAA